MIGYFAVYYLLEDRTGLELLTVHYLVVYKVYP